MEEPQTAYTYARTGRSLTAALVVLGVWGALFFAWTALDAALWIIAVIFCFTLPALSDLLRNPNNGLVLDADQLQWHSGRRQAAVLLEEPDHIQLNTRLDFSVSAAAVLKTGRKIKLPFAHCPLPTASHLSFFYNFKFEFSRFHFTFTPLTKNG